MYFLNMSSLCSQIVFTSITQTRGHWLREWIITQLYARITGPASIEKFRIVYAVEGVWSAIHVSGKKEYLPSP